MSQNLPPIAEWGVAIALCLFLIREGIMFFKSKDASESEQYKALIDDLRNRASKADSVWIPALKAIHTQQQQILVTIQNVERNQADMAIRHNTEMIQTMKQSALALAEVREQLAIIKADGKALHARMDANE